jgi:hypothetical protein
MAMGMSLPRTTPTALAVPVFSAAKTAVEYINTGTTTKATKLRPKMCFPMNLSIFMMSPWTRLAATGPSCRMVKSHSKRDSLMQSKYRLSAARLQTKNVNLYEKI